MTAPKRPSILHSVFRISHWLSFHWASSFTGLMLVFAGLPFVAPWLRANNVEAPSAVIFKLYASVCHQMPTRSYFVFGQQVAYCERNVAIYSSIALAGLAWVCLRHQLPRLGLCGYIVLTAPMAVDGFTQLLGLRESTWALRTVTGGLFGVATVWFAFPIVGNYAQLLRPLFAASPPPSR